MSCSRGRCRAGEAWAAPTWQRRVADAGVPPRALTAVLQGTRAAWRVLVRRGVRGAALWCGQNRGRDVAARARHIQNARSARAQSTHGMCSTKCQGVLDVSGEAWAAPTWQRRIVDASVPPRALTAVLQGTRAAWRVLVRRGVRGAALWCGQNRGRDVAARARHVQNARSARAQSTHGTCSTKCHGVLEVAVEAGKKQG